MITKPHAPFQYATKPYTHQEEDFLRTRDLHYYAFFWEMGVGKSKPILDTAMHLFLRQEIDGVLIVSDKGCYLTWPNDQIPKHIQVGRPIRSAYYSSSMDKMAQRKMAEVMTAKDDTLDFLSINIESLSHESGVSVAKRFLQNHHALMVIDEATSIKNMKAKRTKSCIALGHLAEYRRVATGTPITNAPLDLYAIAEFLAPGLLGFNSYVAFKNYYAVVREVVQGRVRFEQILGYRNLEQLAKSMLPWSSRRLKSECLDLPPKIYETIYVGQTPEQETAYRRLKQEALLEAEQGLITITNALTMIGKLHQINCGHVKTDGGVVIRLPSNRGPILLDLLRNHSGKAVIWAHYREDIAIIRELLQVEFGPQSVVTYFGDTTEEERANNLLRFHDESECRWFVGTPASGGKGLNGLVVADLCIYWSNHYNLERRLQSEDRLHRIGQHRPVTYIDLVCPKTVDVEVVTALRDKRDLATEVLDTLRLMITS